MRDQLEARIVAIEYIHEKFGHDVWEIKEELVRLAKLVETHIKTKAMNPPRVLIIPASTIPSFPPIPISKLPTTPPMYKP